jgi:ParB-like chromosome segregation protein Spo0J
MADCAPPVVGAEVEKPGAGRSVGALERGVAMPFHPAAEMIPPMSDEEYADLLADIREHGQRQKIVVDAEGRVLDGRHRLRACVELGIEPHIEPYLGGDSPVEFVCSLNLRRRHLTQSQLAAIAVDLEEEIAREARERAADRRARKSSGGDSARATSGQAAANLPPRTATQKEALSSRGKAARLTGASPRNISTAKSVREADPTLHEAIKRGDTTVHAAAQKIKKAAPARKSGPEPDIERPKSKRVAWLMQSLTPRRGREREAISTLYDIEASLRAWETDRREALIQILAAHVHDAYDRDEVDNVLGELLVVIRGDELP